MVRAMRAALMVSVVLLPTAGWLLLAWCSHRGLLDRAEERRRHRIEAHPVLAVVLPAACVGALYGALAAAASVVLGSVLAVIVGVYGVLTVGVVTWLARRRVAALLAPAPTTASPPLRCRVPVEQIASIAIMAALQALGPFLAAFGAPRAGPAWQALLLPAGLLAAVAAGTLVAVRRETVLARDGIVVRRLRRRRIAWDEVERVRWRRWDSDLAFEADGEVLTSIGAGLRLETSAGERPFDELVDAVQRLLPEVRADLELVDDRPGWLRRQHAEAG